MKFTQKQLLQIIKEEIDAVVNEDRHTVNFDGLVRLLKNLIIILNSGRLAQSGRALPLQGRSHRFKSCSAHKGFSEIFTYIYMKTAQ